MAAVATDTVAVATDTVAGRCYRYSGLQGHVTISANENTAKHKQTSECANMCYVETTSTVLALLWQILIVLCIFPNSEAFSKIKKTLSVRSRHFIQTSDTFLHLGLRPQCKKVSEVCIKCLLLTDKFFLL